VDVSFAAAVVEEGSDTLSGGIGRASFVDAEIFHASDFQVLGHVHRYAAFGVESVSTSLVSGLLGFMGEAEFLLAETFSTQLTTDKQSVASIFLFETVDPRIYSYIEGVEKFAVLLDVRRRGFDLDCVVKKQER
jgi:hypothetical protein